MSTENNNTETQNTCTQSWKSRLVSILGVAIGLVALGVGSYGCLEDEETNAALVDLGASLAVNNIVNQYPDSIKYLVQATQIIDDAIAARTGKVEDIQNNIKEGINKIAQDEVTSETASIVVVRILNLINSKYNPSDTEEVYINKLNIINTAIKQVINTNNTVSESNEEPLTEL